MASNTRWYTAACLLAAGALSGGILAGTLAANASSGTSTTPSYGSTALQQAPYGAPGGHAGETIITGAKAATLKAAALQAVPGGSVDRVETDSGDATYEVHMTKSDGTQVTVKFAKNLTVTAVEAGMGR